MTSPHDQHPHIEDELLAEKTFYQLWRKSCLITTTKINWVATLFVGCAVMFGTMSPIEHGTVTAQVRAIAELGIAFCSTILGFLIAGFTLFATLTNNKIFLKMAHFTEPNSGLNYLKYTFALFLGVFYEYIVFTGLCVIVKCLCFSGGPASQFIDMAHIGQPLRLGLARCLLIGLSAFLMFLVMQLKSFVFNLHQIIMLAIIWPVVDEVDSDSTPATPAPANDDGSTGAVR